ncbi:MAG TPA: hypothetical protein VGM21_04055 [Actinomycetota bacterium]
MSGAVSYGGEHQALRRALLPYAVGSRCWRCGRPILPGQPVDLGHDDDNPGLYRGLEHARCNRQAGAAKGKARRRERRERMRSMVKEVALGIEVSEDRQHCSVVAAGYLEHGMVLVDLLRYLDGTGPVPAVLALRAERTVVAVVVDPHSHAATCIAPLEAAGVAVTKPASSDVVVAHGGFLDALAAGRVRHQGQAELTAAVRHLAERRLGGATAPERRGAPVDVGPAVAAELAVWALLTAPRPPSPATARVQVERAPADKREFWRPTGRLPI